MENNDLEFSNEVPVQEVVDNPMMNITSELTNPGNYLTTDEKDKIKSLSNIENSVKVGLVNLFMDQFGKVKSYDIAIDKLVTTLMDKVPFLEPDELTNLLSVLTKTRSIEAKSILDAFKKQGDDIKVIIKEVSKEKKGKGASEEEEEDARSKNPIMNMSPEKRDKLLRVLNKISGRS